MVFEIYSLKFDSPSNDLLLKISLGVCALGYKHLFNHWFSVECWFAQVRVVSGNLTPPKNIMSQWLCYLQSKHTRQNEHGLCCNQILFYSFCSFIRQTSWNTSLLFSRRFSSVGMKNIPTAYSPSGGSSKPASLVTCNNITPKVNPSTAESSSLP